MYHIYMCLEFIICAMVTLLDVTSVKLQFRYLNIKLNTLCIFHRVGLKKILELLIIIAFIIGFTYVRDIKGEQGSWSKG